MTLLGVFTDIIIHNPAAKQDFFAKYIPLLSPIIVIVTFVVNNRYNVRAKKAESKRAWYFKAFFEPQIKKVEDFFNESGLYQKKVLDVYQEHLDDWTTEVRTNYIGEALFELANKKRKFEAEVLEAFKLSYPDIFSDIEIILMAYEDAGSEAFENNSTDRYFTYLTKIYKMRTEIINVLSGPALK